MMIKSFFGHLHTVNRHRREVRKLCFKMGLYWQGLTHDLSKYTPAEFWIGVKYFQGFRSPNVMEREKNDIHLHGYIIRVEINIIMNIGMIR